MGEHGRIPGRVLRLAARRLPDINRLRLLFGSVRVQLQGGTDKHLDARGEERIEVEYFCISKSY